MTYNAKNPVSSDQTLLTILERMERMGGGTIQEIAAEIDITESTVHNHLSTLRQEKYVIKEDDRYHLGLRFLALGEAARNQGPLYTFGRPEADRICTKTGELTNLATIESERGVYLYRTQRDSAVRFSTDAGDYHDLHCSATGKAMLAFLPEKALDEVIERHGLTEYTENTITSREALEDELETIQNNQFAKDLEEYEKGLRCIASPILDDNDQTLGAISLSGPAMKFTDDYYDELAEAVKSAANIISLNLTRAEESQY